MTKKLPLLLLACMALPAVSVAQEASPMYKVTKSVTPPDENDKIIFEIPEGETGYFSRDCTSFKYDYEGLSKGDVYGSAVTMTKTDDGTVYFSNPLTEFTLLSYFKGTLQADGSIVIKGPQVIYDEYDDYSEEYVYFYLLPMDYVLDDQKRGTYVPSEDMTFVLKKTENGYEAANPNQLLGLARYGEIADLDGNPAGLGYAWNGFGDLNISFTEHQPTNGVTPPEGAKIERWAFHDPYETALISVVPGENDFYIQGLDRGTPDAWLKATVKDGKITIPSKTFIGINPEIAYYTYMWGADLVYEGEVLKGNSTDEVVFSYDAGAKKLWLEDGKGYGICSSAEHFYLLTLYEKVEVYNQNRNVNTLPAAPYDLEVIPYDDYFQVGRMAFYLPSYDEDDNLLETDKLYYNIYLNDEVYTFNPEEYPRLELTGNMVNVPYSLYDNYTIFMYKDYHELLFDFELNCKCGVQSVYVNEEGKEVRSEIVSVDVSGIDSVGQDKEITSRTCYNLQGQPVSANYRGPVICRTAYSDGTVKVTKMMNRN